MYIPEKHSPIKPGWIPLGSDGLTDEERALEASILPEERLAVRKIFGLDNCASVLVEFFLFRHRKP